MYEQPSPNPEILKILKDKRIVSRICEEIVQDDDLRSNVPLVPLKVSYLCDFIGPCRVEDARGDTEGLERLRIEGQKGILLLLDPEPHANWAHPCWLATVDLDNEDRIQVVRHRFPPLEDRDHRLVTLVTSFDWTRAA